MGIAAIVFVLLTIFALTEGDDIAVTILFGALAVLFIYLWATKDKRKQKQIEKEGLPHHGMQSFLFLFLIPKQDIRRAGR